MYRLNAAKLEHYILDQLQSVRICCPTYLHIWSTPCAIFYGWAPFHKSPLSSLWASYRQKITSFQLRLGGNLQLGPIFNQIRRDSVKWLKSSATKKTSPRSMSTWLQYCSAKMERNDTSALNAAPMVLIHPLVYPFFPRSRNCSLANSPIRLHPLLEGMFSQTTYPAGLGLHGPHRWTATFRRTPIRHLNPTATSHRQARPSVRPSQKLAKLTISPPAGTLHA